LPASALRVTRISSARAIRDCQRRLCRPRLRSLIPNLTAATGDRFGFEAHQIVSFKSLNHIVPLTAAINVIALSPITADVTIREI